jgi:hypothetical protein
MSNLETTPWGEYKAWARSLRVRMFWGVAGGLMTWQGTGSPVAGAALGVFGVVGGYLAYQWQTRAR